MAAITAIMRTQQIILARIEAVLRPHELTFARFELLALLSFTRSGALPMTKASARLQVHPTSVTNTVDRLEQAGLVRRTRHATDGRTTLVEITPAGRRAVTAAAEDLNRTVFAQPGFSDDALASLNGILGQFRLEAGDFSEVAAPADD